jgi:hypothetical protein
MLRVPIFLHADRALAPRRQAVGEDHVVALARQHLAHGLVAGVEQTLAWARCRIQAAAAVQGYDDGALGRVGLGFDLGFGLRFRLRLRFCATGYDCRSGCKPPSLKRRAV